MKKTKGIAKGEKKIDIWTILLFLALLIVVLGVAYFVGIIFSQNENKVVAEKVDMGETGLLVCQIFDKNGGIMGGWAENSETTIKVTYQKKKAKQISYEYIGEHQSHAVAESEQSAMHANYNDVMRTEREKLFTNFMAVENQARVTIYTEIKTMPTAAQTLFHLKGEEINILKNADYMELKKTYEAMNYKCNYQE